MDKPFNFVDPFSQDAVMLEAEMEAMKDYFDNIEVDEESLMVNPNHYVDMSIDNDLLTDELPF